MAKQAEARRMALEVLLTPLPRSLFAEPIELIFADHFRQRTLCGILVQIAEAETMDRELVDASLRFLKTEFECHVLDEEEDLFPLLRRRAEPEDDIDEVLGRLSEQHATAEANAADILDGLSALLNETGDVGVSARFADLLKQFAVSERKHLIVENAIVLPLARVRLTDRDCLNLGRRMAARRGISLSGVPHD